MSEAGIEPSLRRIEELIAALDALADPTAREPARALLEVVLELHALGLARMTATIAATENGAALLQRLAADAPVRAILLLHGMHPQTVEARVGDAVESLRRSLATRGLGVQLFACTASLARVRVRWLSQQPAAIDVALLGQEIEAAIIEAAPDLEMLEIEGLDADAVALAG